MNVTVCPVKTLPSASTTSISTLCWPLRRLANCHTTTRWIRSARIQPDRLRAHAIEAAETGLAGRPIVAAGAVAAASHGETSSPPASPRT